MQTTRVTVYSQAEIQIQPQLLKCECARLWAAIQAALLYLLSIGMGLKEMRVEGDAK